MTGLVAGSVARRCQEKRSVEVWTSYQRSNSPYRSKWNGLVEEWDGTFSEAGCGVPSGTNWKLEMMTSTSCWSVGAVPPKSHRLRRMFSSPVGGTVRI